MNCVNKLCIGVVILIATGLNANANSLNTQYYYSLNHLLNNLNHPDVARGAVIASPSKNSPNYFSHWTRDAAIVMDSVYEVYQRERSVELKEHFKDWVLFEKYAQEQSKYTNAGYGEPRFNVDGTVFTGPWGRPQNDGPALRALTMTKWAFELLSENELGWVKENLYQSSLNSNSIIKNDLEYIAHNWTSPCFDLWEEVNGHHFYTLIVQKKSLLLGAKLADKMQDPEAAKFYREQARFIDQELYQFFDSTRGYIVATLSQIDGWTHKTSQLDVAVILGTLHGYFDRDFVIQNSSWFLATAERLENVFWDLYPINKNAFAAVIGRYPEDVYDGNGFGGGNPWFLATHAYAEFFCKLGNELSSRNLKVRGQNYLHRSLMHVNQSTHEMAEQMNRTNGYMMGARHLTWSYSSYLTAYLACDNP